VLSRSFFKYHFPVIFCCTSIFILSSIPGDKIPEVDFALSPDKIAHFLLYFILCLLFFYSLKNQNKSVKLRNYSKGFAFFFTVLYGLTDEIHQYFVPLRYPAADDLAADFLGALGAYIAVTVFMRKRRRYENTVNSG
jgi:VanZ family protein